MQSARHFRVGFLLGLAGVSVPSSDSGWIPVLFLWGFFWFGCVQTVICGGSTTCKLIFLLLFFYDYHMTYLLTFLNSVFLLLKIVMELDGCSNHLGSSKAKYEAPFAVK